MIPQVVSINAKCALCQTEPCQHSIHVQHLEKSIEGDITLCDGCYLISCHGDDQAVAHLWVALQESQSAGYTDASFVRDLKKALHEGFLGFPAVGWAKWVDERGNELEGAFLLASIPNPKMPTMPRIWCRSRQPLFPALLRVCLDTYPQFDIPDNTLWLDGRYVIAPAPAANGDALLTEKNIAVVNAVMTVYKNEYGDRDVFTILANRMTTVGYELIRRVIL